MSLISRWSTNEEKHEAKNLKVVLFVSRNKDNKRLNGFVERRESFVTSLQDSDDKLHEAFENFVNKGLHGEMSRFYISVNNRDTAKVHSALLHYLIDHPELNLATLPSKVAAIAAKKENAAEKKWLFDLDIDNNDANEEEMLEFIDDLIASSTVGTEGFVDKDCSTYKTPHGYAIITPRGFDTRKLLEKWKDKVTLKRDDLLLVSWDIKRAL